jgi:hypothetical protein
VADEVVGVGDDVGGGGGLAGRDQRCLGPRRAQTPQPRRQNIVTVSAVTTVDVYSAAVSTRLSHAVGVSARVEYAC